MLKSILFLTLLSPSSFAQLADKTEACYGAAVRVAANKIARDSKDKNSILNSIGFVADDCEHKGKTQLIECYKNDDKNFARFDASFESSEYNKKSSQLAEMKYIFKRETQGLEIYYELKFARSEASRSCTYMGTSVDSVGTED